MTASDSAPATRRCIFCNAPLFTYIKRRWPLLKLRWCSNPDCESHKDKS